MMKRFTFLLSFLCLLLAVVPVQAASNPYDFKFQPVNLILRAQQGAVFKQDIFVENDGQYPMDSFIYVRNFKAENGGKTVTFYKPLSSQYDLASWIVPETPHITIAPKQQLYLTLDFKIPDYAKSGTYTGTIFIQNGYANGNVGSGSTVDTQGGINVLLTITKNDAEYTSLYRSPVLENMSVPFLNIGTVAYAGDVANDGAFVNSADIHVNVHNMFLQQVYHDTFQDIDVLPGQYRYLDGVNRTEYIGTLQLGIYKMDISVTDVLKGTTTTSSYYFTVVPFWTIIIFALLICALLIYAIYRKTRY